MFDKPIPLCYYIQVSGEQPRQNRIRPDGQAVKTTPSHGVNPGSIPGQVTCCCRAAAAAFLLGASLAQLVERRIRNA